jgi:hypothetical protein
MSLASPRLRSLVARTRKLYVDHSHCPVLAPATLAALPSTRTIPNRDVFYVAHPVAPLYLARSRSARPLLSWSRGCGIADPSRSIHGRAESFVCRRN